MSANFLRLQHGGRLDLPGLQDLAPERHDRLELTVAGLLGRAAGGVSLHQEEFCVLGVRARAVGQLANDSDRAEAVKSLKTAIETDEYVDVIEEAQKSLEFLGKSEILLDLDESDLLRRSTTGIVPDRTKAISRLGLLQAPSHKAVDACIQLSSHNNQNIRDAALAALIKISAKIDVLQELALRMFDILVKAIKDGEDNDVRTASTNLPKVFDRITVAKLDSIKRNDLADSLIELLAPPLLDRPGCIPRPPSAGRPARRRSSELAAHEGIDRGWFAVPVGFLQSNGDGEFDVALRSALVRGRSATAWAGAGIVARSQPRAEFTETELKLRTVLGPLLWGAP